MTLTARTPLDLTRPYSELTEAEGYQKDWAQCLSGTHCTCNILEEVSCCTCGCHGKATPNPWEHVYLPAPRYPCKNCILGWSSTIVAQADRLRWYDGKGDMFNGGIDDEDEDGSPFERDRFPAGFYCDVCVGRFREMHEIGDENFGPTLAEELERRGQRE